MRARKSRAEWAGLIAEFEGSGESFAAFCARRRLAPATLRWWRWRLPPADTTPAAAGGVQLVAVDVVAPPERSSPPSTVAITIADVNLHIEVGTDCGYVASLVSELRRRC